MFLPRSFNFLTQTWSSRSVSCVRDQDHASLGSSYDPLILHVAAISLTKLFRSDKLRFSSPGQSRPVCLIRDLGLVIILSIPSFSDSVHDDPCFLFRLVPGDNVTLRRITIRSTSPLGEERLSSRVGSCAELWSRGSAWWMSCFPVAVV